LQILQSCRAREGRAVTEFWQASLKETVKNSEDLVRSRSRRKRDVADWFAKYVEPAPTSSNQGSVNLPFQRWFHFKEAFSPKFVADTLAALPYEPNRCLDPFAGSGTTAVTCRMLGVDSVSVEVNPFLADLVTAKTAPVAPADFSGNYNKLIGNLAIAAADKILPSGMPRTFAPPGVEGRYVFSTDVFRTARAIVRRSQAMEPRQARLLRVLLGSVLVENSNVTINGKGRRYRGNWERRRRDGNDLIESLDLAVDNAVQDLIGFAGLPKGSHVVHCGDARQALARVSNADVAIFSPPYPNSFDYTDVYNLELWMLSYLISG
jgi:DNA methylase